MEIKTINELPDELLLKILCSFPTSDHAIRASTLSKRWRSLWKELKIFRYDIAYHRSFPYLRFARLISRRSSVETLHLRLDKVLPVNHLVQTALHRSLTELKFDMFYGSFALPQSLYSSQLQTLILQKLSLDDVPSNVTLPCLKSLHLLSVKFSTDQSVKTLLSICPFVQDLVVKQSSYTTVKIFTIDVPTLRSLSIYTSSSQSQAKGVVHGFVINTPSLRRFSITDSFSNYLRFENMPDLVDVSVNIVSCLSSHLEYLEWRQYHGTEQEREAAKCILSNASHLKKATFYSSKFAEKHIMFNELESVPRGSKTCELVFK